MNDENGSWRFLLLVVVVVVVGRVREKREEEGCRFIFCLLHVFK
jgi:hypothetical protein